MNDYKNIPTEIDDRIQDGAIDMCLFTFHLATKTEEIKTLYCTYEHEYAIRSAARDLGFFKRKAPKIKKIEIKYLKNYGQANERNRN
mgnify:CR=1 FL=1